MCISSGGGTPARDPNPSQVTALGLQLGTTEIQRNQANVLGRLALSSRGNSSGITPGPNTQGPTPGGTLGFAPGANPTVQPAVLSPFALGYANQSRSVGVQK